ncbi:hypothetical protein [Rahnella aquatilis]|nr:hypothetical protein [Rahnella aquatilis]
MAAIVTIESIVIVHRLFVLRVKSNDRDSLYRLEEARNDHSDN